MITDNDKDFIIQCAKKFDVSAVILFGSSLNNEGSNDIDLGVKGIDAKKFFKFYAELFKYLSKPVDLIDLSQKTRFTDLIEETGIRIYG